MSLNEINMMTVGFINSLRLMGVRRAHVELHEVPFDCTQYDLVIYTRRIYQPLVDIGWLQKMGAREIYIMRLRWWENLWKRYTTKCVGPLPPLHFNCRCYIKPLTKNERMNDENTEFESGEH